VGQSFEQGIGQGWAWLTAEAGRLAELARAEPVSFLLAGAGVLVLLGLVLALRLRRPAPPVAGDPASARARSRALATADADGTARAALAVSDLLAALQAAGAGDGAPDRAARLEDQGRNLTHTAGTLVRLAKSWAKSTRTIEPALAALRQGDTGPVCEVLRTLGAAMVRKDGGDPDSAALLVRHLAAMTFIHQPEAALEPARWVTQHLPDSAEAWSLLGLVAAETGALDDARLACEKVLSLGVRSGDQALLAGALGTLGEVHQAQGNLDRAEEYYRIALTYLAGLQRPEGMVRHYRSLGEIYQARGDWHHAAENLAKALALGSGLGDREGVAELELQAGLVAQRRGSVADACGHWARARQVFQELGREAKVEELDGLMSRAFRGT